MPLFAPKCPVSPKARVWTESSFEWLRDQFGDSAMLGDVVTPRRVFESEPYTGSEADVNRLLELVCARMGADREALDLEITEDDEHSNLGSVVPLKVEFDGEAGHFRPNGNRFVVAIGRRQLWHPVAVTAILAHEVGHVRLLGEGRSTTGRADHEQLTDLATVFFGFGVFSANAAFDHTKYRTNEGGAGWRTSHLGYLGERLLGYALAVHAHLRGESDPNWVSELETNPRVYAKKGLRFLEAPRL